MYICLKYGYLFQNIHKLAAVIGTDVAWWNLKRFKAFFPVMFNQVSSGHHVLSVLNFFQQMLIELHAIDEVQDWQPRAHFDMR